MSCPRVILSTAESRRRRRAGLRGRLEDRQEWSVRALRLIRRQSRRLMATPRRAPTPRPLEKHTEVFSSDYSQKDRHGSEIRMGHALPWVQVWSTLKGLPRWFHK